MVLREISGIPMSCSCRGTTMAPLRNYQAVALRTFDDWIKYGGSGRGFNSDVAFITTHNGSTSKAAVVNAVGGHGFEWGGNIGFDASIFGYPANLNRGQIMWACWGRSSDGWIGAHKFNRIAGYGFGGWCIWWPLARQI